ncbi:unnamed protein product [Anisakis simplex]|uniref:Protein kinase domain-containing protein n=1 Tax=Anisakis simplex TaxID=6269 RepID=A0A0M3JGH8_ANISI|nr:unnamed protein product [Anisakis simplex]
MERRRAQLKKEQAAAADGTGVDGSTSAEGADAAAEVGSSMDVAGGKEGRPSGGDEDEEAPPHLDPEGAPVGEEVLEMDNVERTQLVKIVSYKGSMKVIR